MPSVPVKVGRRFSCKAREARVDPLTNLPLGTDGEPSEPFHCDVAVVALKPARQVGAGVDTPQSLGYNTVSFGCPSQDLTRVAKRDLYHDKHDSEPATD